MSRWGCRRQPRPLEVLNRLVTEVRPAHRGKQQRRAGGGDDAPVDLGRLEHRVDARLDHPQLAARTQLRKESPQVRKRPLPHPAPR
jgi:hypothetical protein